MEKGKEKVAEKKRLGIPKLVRIATWRARIGEEYFGECYVCRAQVNVFEFECGHIVSDKDGGLPTLDNLTVICSSCNRSMGATNMLDVMIQYGFTKGQERKDMKRSIVMSAIHHRLAWLKITTFRPSDVYMEDATVRKYLCKGVLEYNSEEEVYVYMLDDWHLMK